MDYSKLAVYDYLTITNEVETNYKKVKEVLYRVSQCSDCPDYISKAYRLYCEDKCDDVQKMLLPLVKEGNPWAVVFLYDIVMKKGICEDIHLSYTELFKYLQDAAQKGYVAAVYLCGRVYACGDLEVFPDKNKALDYLNSAAQQQFALAFFELGVLELGVSFYSSSLDSHIGVDKKFKALDFFEKSYRLGNLFVINWMYMIYHGLSENTVDSKERQSFLIRANELFEEGVRRECPRMIFSQVKKCLKHKNKEERRKILSERISLISQAAELGSREACYTLYLVYTHGCDLIKPDSRMAYYYLDLAVKFNHYYAMYEQAGRYMKKVQQAKLDKKSFEIESLKKEAYALYKCAAYKGEIHSQYKLGDIYSDKGEYQKASKYYQLACENMCPNYESRAASGLSGPNNDAEIYYKKRHSAALALSTLYLKGVLGVGQGLNALKYNLMASYWGNDSAILVLSHGFADARKLKAQFWWRRLWKKLCMFVEELLGKGKSLRFAILVLYDEICKLDSDKTCRTDYLVKLGWRDDSLSARCGREFIRAMYDESCFTDAVNQIIQEQDSLPQDKREPFVRERLLEISEPYFRILKKFKSFHLTPGKLKPS